ncbi:MAG: hypothetical protein AAFV51_00975 [Pseudomonadota bacterium]
MCTEYTPENTGVDDMSRFCLQALCAACCLFFVSCSSTSENLGGDEIRIEKSAGGYFAVRSLGLKFRTPDGWFAMNQNQLDFLSRVGTELFVGDDATKQAAAEVAQSKILLSFSKYELGAPVTFNPITAILLEDIRLFPGVKTGDVYLRNAGMLMSADSAAAVSEEITEVENFDGLFEMKVVRDKVHQTYYATVRDGYAIGIIETHGFSENYADFPPLGDYIVLE